MTDPRDDAYLAEDWKNEVWPEDDWDDEDAIRTDDHDYCAAPGSERLGLCVDDMCRGAGVCMFVAALGPGQQEGS